MQRDVLAAMQEAGARAIVQTPTGAHPREHSAAVLRAALPVLREAVEGMRVSPLQGRWGEGANAALDAVLALLNDGKGER